MPLIKIEHIAEKTSLGLWEATEPLDYFSDLPEGYLTGLNDEFSEKRKKEFYASRYLLRKMLGDDGIVLSRSEHGQIRIESSDLNISLSHSGNLMAAMISHDYKVGIDVEEIRPKVQRVMHKFLSDEEIAAIGDPPDIQMLILCWSAKETIYKLMGIQGLLFREQIRLQIPSSWSEKPFDARVETERLKVNLNIFFEVIKGEYVMTRCHRK